MDTSFIPISTAFLSDILVSCAVIYAVSWGISKVVQLFKKQ